MPKPTSTNINQHQPISTNINQHQPISTNINQHQPISTNINQHQPISTNINQHQPTSTNINQHQATSTNINQHQQISTNINKYQPISTNINQHDCSFRSTRNTSEHNSWCLKPTPQDSLPCLRPYTEAQHQAVAEVLGGARWAVCSWVQHLKTTVWTWNMIKWGTYFKYYTWGKIWNDII